jgi:hypothetical protein
MVELAMLLLSLQAVMGAFDTLWHHEILVGLPRQPGARAELRLHALRALIYALLFAGLAWFRWGGAWVLLLVALVLVEVLLTLQDFVVEDRSRLLPASERITHTLLAINGGAAFGLMGTADRLACDRLRRALLVPQRGGCRCGAVRPARCGRGLAAAAARAAGGTRHG